MLGKKLQYIDRRHVGQCFVFITVHVHHALAQKKKLKLAPLVDTQTTNKIAAVGMYGDDDDHIRNWRGNEVSSFLEHESVLGPFPRTST